PVALWLRFLVLYPETPWPVARVPHLNRQRRWSLRPSRGHMPVRRRRVLISWFAPLVRVLCLNVGAKLTRTLPDSIQCETVERANENHPGFPERSTFVGIT